MEINDFSWMTEEDRADIASQIKPPMSYNNADSANEGYNVIIFANYSEIFKNYTKIIKAVCDKRHARYTQENLEQLLNAIK